MMRMTFITRDTHPAEWLHAWTELAKGRNLPDGDTEELCRETGEGWQYMSTNVPNGRGNPIQHQFRHRCALPADDPLGAAVGTTTEHTYHDRVYANVEASPEYTALIRDREADEADRVRAAERMRERLDDTGEDRSDADSGL